VIDVAWHLPVTVWLAQAALGGFLVLAIGCVAVNACRQPVRRVRLIELTLLTSLFVPWVSRLPWLPHWSTGLLALIPSVPETVPAQPEKPIVAVPAVGEVRSAAAEVFVTQSLDAPRPVTVSPTEAAPTAPVIPAAETPRVDTRFLSALVVTIYGCVVAGLAGWWLIGLGRLLRIYRSASAVPSNVVALFREIAGPAGGSVQLLASERVELPLTFTAWRPVILLPGKLCHQGDTAALRFCLAHEWSHVDRGDSWRWNLATLVQFFFFYQPFFWWLRRQLRLCQDYLADARAAEQAPEVEDYASYLVRLAGRQICTPAAALGIGDRRSNLYRRIVMLLHSRQPLERRCLRGWNLAATLAAVLLLACVAAVRLDAGTPADDKKEPPVKQTPKETAKGEPAKNEALKYTGKVTDKDTGKPIEGATVTVRRSLLGDPEAKQENEIIEETKHKTDAEGKYSFIIPPEQVAKRYLYIELDVEAPDHAPQKHFGYALSMILKNEKLGGRPFFENVELRPGKEITGLIKTPDGKPASGVKVLTYSVTNKPGAGFEYGSFADARTDADGRFRIVVTTPGSAVVWILPDQYAPSTHRLKDNKRGDLGTFTLREGIRVRGKVLDVQGKPVADINVNVENADRNEELDGLPVADSIARSALTNAKGEFETGPLPPGNYRVKPDEHVRENNKEDRTRRPVPGVFVAQKVTLKEGTKPDPVEVRATPHVTIEAQYYDSKGKTTRGHAFFVFGQMDKSSWFGQGKADTNGKITAYVPHGLENVQLDLMTNEHGVLRHRMKPSDPLRNNRRIHLGTVNDDVKGIEIIRYEAPILLVKVSARDGGKLEKLAVTANYEAGRGQFEGRLIVSDGRRSDVSFEKQEDGRFRSMQLLPDEEVTVTGHAEGYVSKSEKFKLPEGVTKEIEIVLEKAPAEKKDGKKEEKK
jgi:beta-lactamase regulating signal transducer with metallopeptidase domain/protocatechuate 3,4-dioxygenase beta subunit